MRLPIYRAWGIEKQRMGEVMDLRCMQGAARHALLYDPNGHHPYVAYPDKCILMQFTGLKDKNGVEIYEGDVVRDSNGIVSTIAWEASEAKFCATDSDISLYCAAEAFEIIGNIYENPELASDESSGDVDKSRGKEE